MSDRLPAAVMRYLIERARTAKLDAYAAYRLAPWYQWRWRGDCRRAVSRMEDVQKWLESELAKRQEGADR